jgi:2,4-dienoyl-CoA reductase-like NADH-dependent reductase (Old Yellow Enzyme family)
MPLTILQSYQLTSQLKLKNRIVMAPMTRRKANDDGSPGQVMTKYYADRADAGLIVTEGTLISEDAIGYGNIPGIYTKAHIAGWKKITDAVHENGGLIFLQLWHCGRVSHPVFHQGQLPLSASSTEMTETVLGSSGYKSGMSRAATINEIHNIINDYATAAKNAMYAGFDGVELHGANGYLIDQFLHYCSNKRTDIYGGASENMARFCLECVHACGKLIGYEKVGLRLSPGGYLFEIKNHENDHLVFSYLLNQLQKLEIAYVHTGNFDDSVRFPYLNNMTMTEFIRSQYTANLIATGSYTIDSAEKGINDNKFNLAGMGRPFIANYDLILKIKQGIPLNPYHPDILQTTLNQN